MFMKSLFDNSSYGLKMCLSKMRTKDFFFYGKSFETRLQEQVLWQGNNSFELDFLKCFKERKKSMAPCLEFLPYKDD